MTHLSDDKAVAKMGHPIVVVRSDLGHPSIQNFVGVDHRLGVNSPRLSGLSAGLLAIKLLRIDRSNHELRRCNLGCTDGEGCRPGAFSNHQIFPMHQQEERCPSEREDRSDPDTCDHSTNVTIATPSTGASQVDLCPIDRGYVLQAHLELPGTSGPLLWRGLCYRSNSDGADRNDNIAIDHHIFRYRKSNALADHRTSRTDRLCKLEVNLRTIRNHGDALCHWSGGNRTSDDHSRSWRRLRNGCRYTCTGRNRIRSRIREL